MIDLEQASLLDFQVSRRAFLGGAAGLGFSFSLGFALPGAARAQAGEQGKMNAYVAIAPDGAITIQQPVAEMGQGISTGLPLIVAEELDADWQAVEVRQSAISQELYGLQLAGGSTSIPMNFETLRRAGATARAMLVAAAAETWSVPKAELTAELSVVRHAASGRSATYGDLAAVAATLPAPDPASVRFVVDRV